MTRSSGATDYWRFPWLRYRNQYVLEMRPPIVLAALLQDYPNLRFQFVRARREALTPEVYFPLEGQDSISRQFSRLSDPDGVLAFANDYGLLGFEEVPRLQRFREEVEENGECVNEWLWEAEKLKRLYDVWDFVEVGNEKGLREIIRWSDGGVSAIFGEAQIAIADRSRNNTSWIHKWKSGDVFGPARLFLVDQFNLNAVQMASPMLLLDASGALRPYNAPASLLAALWLEFGQVASGVRKQKLCESCGRWMDVTNNSSHKRKHDRCSLREKMARYRQRKKVEDAKAQARQR